MDFGAAPLDINIEEIEKSIARRVAEAQAAAQPAEDPTCQDTSEDCPQWAEVRLCWSFPLARETFVSRTVPSWV